MGVNIHILEDGYAYVETDDGQRETIEVPYRTNENSYYTLEYYERENDEDTEGVLIRTIEADTEEELYEYMCNMVNMIHGPGKYIYSLNKLNFKNEDNTVGVLENILTYYSNTEYSPNEHSEYFGEEPISDSEEDYLNFY
jgi:hypothetical protein